MKQSKRYTALALVGLTSALFLGACGGNKQDATTASSSNKTSQSTKMSSSSTKSKTDKKTQSASSDEMKEEASASQESQSVNSEDSTKGENQQTDKASSEMKNAEGKGSWDTTDKKGVLDFYGDTPVYAEQDKNSEVAFVQPAGTSLEWDNYTISTDDNWYTVVVKGGNEVTHYYVAYSDVKH